MILPGDLLADVERHTLAIGRRASAMTRILLGAAPPDRLAAPDYGPRGWMSQQVFFEE